MKKLLIDMKNGKTYTFWCVRHPEFLKLIVIFYTKYGPVELLQNQIKGIRLGSL